MTGEQEHRSRNKRTLPAPRDWVVNDPDHTKFGSPAVDTVFTLNVDDHDKALSLAAKEHHRFAQEARYRIRISDDLTTASVAARCGMTVDQLRRILRGEVHLTLADRNLIALYTGFQVPGIRSTYSGSDDRRRT